MSQDLGGFCTHTHLVTADTVLEPAGPYLAVQSACLISCTPAAGLCSQHDRRRVAVGLRGRVSPGCAFERGVRAGRSKPGGREARSRRRCFFFLDALMAASRFCFSPLSL